jgi:uncharacterized protein
MELDIQHDRAAGVFSALVDGEHCELDYHLDGTTMTITHTGVPPAVGGRGIAGALTRHALGVARLEGWKVVPACSYAREFFARNNAYADLLA